MCSGCCLNLRDCAEPLVRYESHRRLRLASTGLGQKTSAWARKAVAACASGVAARSDACAILLHAKQVLCAFSSLNSSDLPWYCIGLSGNLLWPAVIAPGILSLAACTKPPSAFFAQMVREAGQNPRIAACRSTHVCSLSATLRCDVRSPVPCLARAERCEPLPTRLHRDCSRLLAADQFVALVHALRHGRMWTQDAVRIHVAPATITSDHVHLAL